MKRPPRGLVEEDAELPLQPAPWTNDETEALHRMVREFLFMEQVRKRGARWAAFFLGVPGIILLLWDQFEKIWKLISWKVK